MTNIFIANLDWTITSEDLQATFSSFGEVHYAHVVFDAKSKKSKGFGYIEMPNAEEAIAAIQALNGFDVNGRPLDVKIASPKANRPKKEDKPKPQFVKKPGGFKKPYNNSGGGGGYQNRDNKPYERKEGGGTYQKPEGYVKREENSSVEKKDYSSPAPAEFKKPTEGERVLRKRKNTQNPE
jgi:cold-inducible RNA-binding protein